VAAGGGFAGLIACSVEGTHCWKVIVAGWEEISRFFLSTLLLGERGGGVALGECLLGMKRGRARRQAVGLGSHQNAKSPRRVLSESQGRLSMLRGDVEEETVTRQHSTLTRVGEAIRIRILWPCVVDLTGNVPLCIFQAAPWAIKGR